MSREQEVKKYGNHAAVLEPELLIEDLISGMVGLAFGMVNLGRLPQMSESAGEPQMYYIAEWPNGRHGAHENTVKVLGTNK